MADSVVTRNGIIIERSAFRLLTSSVPIFGATTSPIYAFGQCRHGKVHTSFLSA